MQFRLWLIPVLLGALTLGPLTAPAMACPMCKQANEQDEATPRAFMYSILFMLAVPATLFTGFGIGFYRLSKRPSAGTATWDEVDRDAKSSWENPPADRFRDDA
jgi:hypothetical protein